MSRTNRHEGRKHVPKQHGGPMGDRRTKRLRTRGNAERDAVREYEDDRRADEDDILDVLDTINPEVWDDPDLSGPEWDDPDYGCGCDDCRGVCRECGLAPCGCDYLAWAVKIP